MAALNFCSFKRALLLLALISILCFSFLGQFKATDLESARSCIHANILEPLRCPGTAKESSPQKTNAKVAVVTFNTKETSYTVLSLKNKQKYAQRHGYDFIVDYETNLKPTASGIWWHKFHMAKRILESKEYEWIWWVDFDTLITNYSIPITDVINEALAKVDNPKEIDFLLNDDCNKLNAGSMIVRGTHTALNTINEVMEYGEQNPKVSEQEALLDVIKKNNMAQRPFSPAKEQGENSEQPDLKREKKGSTTNGSVIMVPQYKINAFPEEIGCFDEHRRKWEPGMLIIHFAGAWAHIKDEDAYGVMMRKYEGRIVDK